MIIDLSQTITDLEGQPIMREVEKVVKGKQKPVITRESVDLLYVLTRAALADLPTDDATDVDGKVARFQLAVKLTDVDSQIDLTLEERKLLRERIGPLFSTIVVGRAYAMLD